MPQDDGTVLVPLSQDQFAVIDAADTGRVLARKWYLISGYAAAGARTMGNFVLMHHLILPPIPGLHTDHVNGNRADNRRANLRHATIGDNNRNGNFRAKGVSGYRGVYPNGKKWMACIHVGGRMRYIGTYANAEEAAHARDDAARELHGEFADLNFP